MEKEDWEKNQDSWKTMIFHFQLDSLQQFFRNCYEKDLHTCTWKQLYFLAQCQHKNIKEYPSPVCGTLPHQYGQHLISVLCTDDAVLMVNAEQHNLCLKLGIIQQVFKVLPEINQFNKTAAYFKHFNPCYHCKYTFKWYLDF